jgi:hypothetical protein
MSDKALKLNCSFDLILKHRPEIQKAIKKIKRVKFHVKTQPHYLTFTVCYTRDLKTFSIQLFSHYKDQQPFGSLEFHRDDLKTFLLRLIYFRGLYSLQKTV